MFVRSQQCRQAGSGGSVMQTSIYILSHHLNHISFYTLPSNDPIKVSRHIAAIVNSKDDRGIVVGNWGEDFNGGTEPTGWHGSAAILQQFYRTKKSVKFGQCWVFSGVTCTSKHLLFVQPRLFS